MSEILEYKCPCCGGKLEFNSSVQKMKCPYCDTEFDVETLKQYDDVLESDKSSDMSWTVQENDGWASEETDGMAVYVCKSCGGEIVGDKNMAATQCPYCGNPVVISGNFSGDLKPNMVIPFKLDKKAAKDALSEHLKKKTLLPNAFKTDNHIDEIQGVYVPFWLFDADVNANYRYKATKVREWTSGNYEYKETSYYSVSRLGDIAFEKVPVDGSTKMPDDLMESVEPYDNSQAVDFQTAYLAGYLADRYDVTSDDCIERANERIKRSTRDEFLKTANQYDSVDIENESLNLSNGLTRYALYPVWILNTTWNEKKFLFAMNGQSGKFVGNLPLDKGKMWLHMILTFVIVAALVYVLGRFVIANDSPWEVIALIAGAIVSAIRTGILVGQLKSVKMQDAAANYIKKGSFKLTGKNDLFLYKQTSSRRIKDN